MKIQITISPDLDLNTADFISEWNNSPESRAVAEALQAGQPKGIGFPIDPEMLNRGLILLAGFTGTVVSSVLINLVTEQIQSLIAKRKAKADKPKIEVKQVRQPDGSILLVIHDDN